MHTTPREKLIRPSEKGHHKDLLRLITCGSVDDGKSTLVGRLLYESHMIYDDHLEALHRDSKKYGTTGNNIDFALLVDGLTAEREQGITIDVAYRFFSTPRRAFIMADVPGHEQYTRNMLTGASTADLAILLLDVRKGLVTQTRRHAFIVALLGIKHLLLVVNKMDLVQYDRNLYEGIKEECQTFISPLGINTLHVMPLSALTGENILQHSPTMSWYQGPTLIEYLEQVNIDVSSREQAFRMPVQWVNHPHQEFRGLSGRVVAGTITPGQKIILLPSGKETTINSLVSYDGIMQSAQTGESITCVLDDELDASRGEILCAATNPCQVADRFEVTVFWLSDKPMIAAREYLFKLATTKAIAVLSSPQYCIDVHTGARAAATTLTLNELGRCELSLDRLIAFESYELNRDLGSFILIDRLSNTTMAGGLIHGALHHSHHIYPYPLSVNGAMRAALKGQKPVVLWFTGLSGSGKSTIANLIEQKLHALTRHSILLDGDNIRQGLNRDLGFSDTDRVENIRRVAEVAKLMIEAGLITIVSFISPFAAEREMACQLIGPDHFMEIYIDVPLVVAEARDPKGLYKKARLGEIKQFTGIDSPYEPPISPALKLNTALLTPQQSAEYVIDLLYAKGLLT